MTMQTEQGVLTIDEAGEPIMSSIMIQVPVDLKMLIKSHAAAENVTTGSWARQVVADHLEYDGRLSRTRTRAKKYATEAQRQAVTKARGTARREIMKELMDQYKDKVDELLSAAEAQALENLEGENTV